ncbi:hypothetical protein EON80_17815 [bacterium]|nr:MAG: hypothetical protein EON80_17815 [bacterium]
MSTNYNRNYHQTSEPLAKLYKANGFLILRGMSRKKIQVTNEQLSAVMSNLGSRTSEAKTKTSRANIQKAIEARRKNPLDSICICDGGDSLKASDHKTTCPRGRLLWQRERAAKARDEKAKLSN